MTLEEIYDYLTPVFSVGTANLSLCIFPVPYFIFLVSHKGSSLSYSLNGGPFGEYSEPIAIKDDTSLTVKTKEQGQPSFFLSSKVTVIIDEAP